MSGEQRSSGSKQGPRSRASFRSAHDRAVDTSRADIPSRSRTPFLVIAAPMPGGHPLIMDTEMSTAHPYFATVSV